MAVIQQEIIKNGKWTSERDFLHKNGSSFFGSVTANAVKDEKGEMSAVFFILKDISLHKQLEEQLKRSNEELEEKVRIRTLQVKKREARFRALIENSNDIITLMDKDFKLLYRSPAATRVLGWTDEDMIGVEATTNIHPEDRDYGASVVKEVMASEGDVVLFIDEIHRFSKSQQDSLLAAVEKGWITLIGATTENPSFEVIPALLSRCQVYVLNPFSKEDLLTLLDRAMKEDKLISSKKIKIKIYK